MSGLAATGLVIVGLLILAGGGELLVRGATALARLMGLSAAVIGLTVVAAGTSVPELVVSLLAALRGSPDIAMGNVVGSNLFNILLVLGLTSIVAVLPVHGSAVKVEWPFMLVATCITFLLARDGQLDRLEGGFLLLSLILFLAFMVRTARRDVGPAEAREISVELGHRTLRLPGTATLLSLAAITGGVLLLVMGGELLVSGAVRLAELAGLSERVIGLTVVAAGTSMPEVAASLVAALRRHTDVAVANLIGSNIFNLLGILGTTALVRPVPVAAGILQWDFLWLLGASLVMFPILRSGMRVTRAEGIVLLGGYVIYSFLLFM